MRVTGVKSAKSIDEHIATGTYKPYRNESNFNESSALPEKPHFLSQEESDFWDEIVSARKDMRLLHPTDSWAITALVQAEFDFRKLRSSLLRLGFDAPEASPLLRQLTAMDTRRRKWYEELGLTPAARRILTKGKTELQSNDLFDGFD